MSKRCKLQKEYYKEFGNYKGSGKYTDHYVNWLESKVIAINYTRSCETFYCECDAPFIRTNGTGGEYCANCNLDLEQ